MKLFLSGLLIGCPVALYIGATFDKMNTQMFIAAALFAIAAVINEKEFK